MVLLLVQNILIQDITNISTEKTNKEMQSDEDKESARVTDSYYERVLACT